jgi:hypothetical protein
LGGAEKILPREVQGLKVQEMDGDLRKIHTV